MKAFSIDEAGKFSITERVRPEAADGEVLLRVRRVGYCGSDLNTFRGLNPMVKYPCIPGHEVAAEVEGVSAGVPESIRPGLRVTVVPYTNCGKCSSCRVGRLNACRFNQTLGVQRNGVLTDYIAVPWQKLVLAPHLSDVELALVEPLSVGFHAADRGAVGERESVAVFGSGMIGLGAIASAALMRKARVIAIDVDDAKLDVARQAGASETINSKTQDLHARMQELTGGDGPSVIIEAVGLPQTFLAAVDEVAFAGRVVYIGYAKEPVTYQTKNFVMKELDVRGSRNATPVDFENVVKLLSSKRYPVAATVSHTLPFARAGEALQMWSAAPQKVTKIQIEL